MGFMDKLTNFLNGVDSSEELPPSEDPNGEVHPIPATNRENDNGGNDVDFYRGTGTKVETAHSPDGEMFALEGGPSEYEMMRAYDKAHKPTSIRGQQDTHADIADVKSRDYDLGIDQHDPAENHLSPLREDPFTPGKEPQYNVNIGTPTINSRIPEPTPAPDPRHEALAGLGGGGSSSSYSKTRGGKVGLVDLMTAAGVHPDEIKYDDKGLKAAQDESRSNRDRALLAKAGLQLGGAIGHTTIDSSIPDALLADADRPLAERSERLKDQDTQGVGIEAAVKKAYPELAAAYTPDEWQKMNRDDIKSLFDVGKLKADLASRESINKANNATSLAKAQMQEAGAKDRQNNGWQHERNQIQQERLDWQKGQHEIFGLEDMDPAHPMTPSVHQKQEYEKQSAARKVINDKVRQIAEIIKDGVPIGDVGTKGTRLKQLMAELYPTVAASGAFGNLTSGHQHLLDSVIGKGGDWKNLINPERLPEIISEIGRAAGVAVQSSAAAMGKREYSKSGSKVVDLTRLPVDKQKKLLELRAKKAAEEQSTSGGEHPIATNVEVQEP